MSSWIKLAKTFRRDASGASAVEFAIILPFLALSAIGVSDLAIETQRRMELDQALRAGAQLAMQGVADEALIESAVANALPYSPQSLNVTAVRQCECSAVAHACSTPCSDNSPPEIYVRLTADASFTVLRQQSRTVNASLSVRLR